MFRLARIAPVIVSGGLLSNTAQAQLFNPDSITGAMFGGLTGAIIGDCASGRPGPGAAIGAGAGFLLGNLSYASRKHPPPYYYSDPYPASYSVSVGVGAGYCGGPGYVGFSYSTPVYVSPPPPPVYAPPPPTQPVVYAPAPRPNYAVSGAIVGSATGAIIGSASHEAGQGALIGAAAGLVLGGIAEHSARAQERNYAAAYVPPPPAPAYVAPPPAPTYVPPAASAPVSSPVPQPRVLNAPGVPDAPVAPMAPRA